MDITEYTVEIGAQKPFFAYHMSDNHICLADERDGKRKTELAADRENCFCGNREKSTSTAAGELFDFIKKENALLIHTGDLIDFVSCSNLEYAKKLFDGADCIACAGNHEFSLYVGEAWEDEEYKAQSLDKVCESFPAGIIFGVREVNGVQFITLDNSYYYILPELYEKTEAALANGKPSVLIVHTPLYSAETYEKIMKGKPSDEPPYLCGCPETLLKNLNEHRFRQQCPDDITYRFIELCNGSKNLKAVLTGHIHRPLFSHLESGAVQIAADGAYGGTVNRIRFI